MSQPSVVVLDDSDDGGAPGATAAAASSSSSAAATAAPSALDLTFAPAETAAIRDALLSWYAAHRRKLPWRGDPPPYTSAVEARAKSAAAAKGRGGKGKAAAAAAAAAAADAPSSVDAPAGSPDAAAAGDAPPPPPPPPAVSAYGTWVSEVMLQQTRVEAVCEHWTRWMARFPSVQALADAPEDDVVAAWAGLGYYRRARNLRKGAQTVVGRFGGAVPGTVPQLLELEGVGEYTAGAIASIAFNQPVPLVDGNVVRVFSRLRGASADAKSPALAKACWAAARGLVDPLAPGAFNQGLMELGATVCTPQSPACGSCPLRATGACRGYAAGVAALRDGSLDAAVAAAEGGGGGDIEDLGAAAAGGSAAAEQAPVAKRPKQASLLGFFKKAPVAPAAAVAAAEPAAVATTDGGSSSASSSSSAAAAASPATDALSPDDLARVGRFIAARYPLKAAKKASPTEHVAVAVITAAALPRSAVAGSAAGSGSSGGGDDGADGSSVIDGPFFLFTRDNGAPPADAPAAPGGKKGKKGAAAPAAAKTSALLERQWQPLTVSLGRVAAASAGAGSDDDQDDDGEEESAAPSPAGKGKAGGKRRRPAVAAPTAPTPATESALLVEGAASLLGLRVMLPAGGNGATASASSSSASAAAAGAASGSPLALASAAHVGRVGHVFSHVTHDVGVHAWAVAVSAPGGVGAAPVPSPHAGLEARWARPADFPALGLTTWACKVLHPALKALPAAVAAVAAVTGGGRSPAAAASGSSSADAAADAAGWRWLAERWAKAGLKR
jgi:A/G-specific adenine glycosylase